MAGPTPDFASLLACLSDPRSRCQGPELTGLLQALCKQLISAANETNTVIWTSAERARASAAADAAASAATDLCVSAPEECSASPLPPPSAGDHGPDRGQPDSSVLSLLQGHPPSAVSASSTLPVLGSPPGQLSSRVLVTGADPQRAHTWRRNPQHANRRPPTAMTTLAAAPPSNNSSGPGPSAVFASNTATAQPNATTQASSTGARLPELVTQGIALLVEHLEHFHYRAKGVSLDGLLSLSAVGLGPDRRLDPAGFASAPPPGPSGCPPSAASAAAAAAAAAAFAAAAANPQGADAGAPGAPDALLDKEQLLLLAGLDAAALHDTVGALGGLGLGDWLALRIVEAGALPRLLEMLAQRTGVNMVPVRQLASQVLHNLSRRRNAAVRAALCRWRPLPGLISALDVVLEDHPDIASRLLLALSDIFPSTAHQLAGPLHRLLLVQQQKEQDEEARKKAAAAAAAAAAASEAPQGAAGKGGERDAEWQPCVHQGQEAGHGQAQRPPPPPTKSRQGWPMGPGAAGGGAAGAGNGLLAGGQGAGAGGAAAQAGAPAQPEQPAGGGADEQISTSTGADTSAGLDPTLGLAPEVDVPLEELLTRVVGYYMRLAHNAVFVPKPLPPLPPPVAPPPAGAHGDAAQRQQQAQRDYDRAVLMRRVEEHRRRKKEGAQLDCCVAAMLASAPMPRGIFDLLAYSYGKAVGILRGPPPALPLTSSASGGLWRPLDLLPYSLALLQNLGGGGLHGDADGGAYGAGGSSTSDAGSSASGLGGALGAMLPGVAGSAPAGAAAATGSAAACPPPPPLVAATLDCVWGLRSGSVMLPLPGAMCGLGAPHGPGAAAAQQLMLLSPGPGPRLAALDYPGPGPALPGAPYGDRPVNEGLVVQLREVVRVVLQRATQAAEQLTCAVQAVGVAAHLASTGEGHAATSYLSQARQLVVLPFAVVRWLGGALASLSRAQVAACVAEDVELLAALASSLGSATGCTAAATAQALLTLGLANVWACAHAAAAAAAKQQAAQAAQQRRRRARPGAADGARQVQVQQTAEGAAAHAGRTGSAAAASGAVHDSEHAVAQPADAEARAPQAAKPKPRGGRGKGAAAAAAASAPLRRSSRLKRGREGSVQPSSEDGTASQEVAAAAPSAPACAGAECAAAAGARAGAPGPSCSVPAADAAGCSALQQHQQQLDLPPAPAADGEQVKPDGKATAAQHGGDEAAAEQLPPAPADPEAARRGALLGHLVELLAARFREARQLHLDIEQQQRQLQAAAAAAGAGARDVDGAAAASAKAAAAQTVAQLSALLAIPIGGVLGTEGCLWQTAAPGVLSSAGAAMAMAAAGNGAGDGNGEAAALLDGRLKQSLDGQALLLQAVALLLPGLDAAQARSLVRAGAVECAARLLHEAASTPAKPRASAAGAGAAAQGAEADAARGGKASEVLAGAGAGMVQAVAGGSGGPRGVDSAGGQQQPSSHEPEAAAEREAARWGTEPAHGVTAMQALGVLQELLRLAADSGESAAGGDQAHGGAGGGGDGSGAVDGRSACAACLEDEEVLAALGGAALLAPPAAQQQSAVQGLLVRAPAGPSGACVDLLRSLVAGSRRCPAHDAALQLLPALLTLTGGASVRCAAAREALLPVLQCVAGWTHSKAQVRRVILQAVSVWSPQLQPLLRRLPCAATPPAHAPEAPRAQPAALTTAAPSAPRASDPAGPPAEPPAAAAAAAAAPSAGGVVTRSSAYRTRSAAHSGKGPSSSQSTLPYPGLGGSATPTTAATAGGAKAGAAGARNARLAGVQQEGRAGSAQQQQQPHQRTPSYAGGEAAGQQRARGGGAAVSFASPTRHEPSSSANGLGLLPHPLLAPKAAGRRSRLAPAAAAASSPPDKGAPAAAGAAAAPSAHGIRKYLTAGSGAHAATVDRAKADAGGGASRVLRASFASAAAAAAAPALSGPLAQVLGLLGALCGRLGDGEVVRHLHATGWLRALCHGATSADAAASAACCRVLTHAGQALAVAIRGAPSGPPPAAQHLVRTTACVAPMQHASTGATAARASASDVELVGLLESDPRVAEVLRALVPELDTAADGARAAAGGQLHRWDVARQQVSAAAAAGARDAAAVVGPAAGVAAAGGVGPAGVPREERLSQAQEYDNGEPEAQGSQGGPSGQGLQGVGRTRRPAAEAGSRRGKGKGGSRKAGGRAAAAVAVEQAEGALDVPAAVPRPVADGEQEGAEGVKALVVGQEAPAGLGFGLEHVGGCTAKGGLDAPKSPAAKRRRLTEARCSGGDGSGLAAAVEIERAAAEAAGTAAEAGQGDGVAAEREAAAAAPRGAPALRGAELDADAAAGAGCGLGVAAAERPREAAPHDADGAAPQPGLRDACNAGAAEGAPAHAHGAALAAGASSTAAACAAAGTLAPASPPRAAAPAPQPPPVCPSPERRGARICLQLTAREAALARAMRAACVSLEAALAARRHDLASARAAEQAAAAAAAAAASTEAGMDAGAHGGLPGPAARTGGPAAVYGRIPPGAALLRSQLQGQANPQPGAAGAAQQGAQARIGGLAVVADADYLSHTYRGVSKRLNFDDL